MIEIDGSYLEGGGQILRTSIALSAITGKPCKIFNIRAKRCKSGLAAQHFRGIKAAALICDATLKGAKLGSSAVEFIPGKIKGGEYKINIGTAGSIFLVLQTLVPPSLHADKKVSFEIIGGTDVKWSPSTTYFQEIFCRFLKKMGVEIESETLRYGFYPKGGGKVKTIIKPCQKLKPIDLVERGRLKRIDIKSIVSKYLEKSKVAERQIEGAKKVFDKFDSEYFEYVDTFSPGSFLHMHAHYDNCILGSTVLGERGKPAEKVGGECALLLKKQIDSNACLDRWMADQIIPYMALAGNSKVSVAEVTKHTKTNIWVTEKFLPVKFKIDRNIIKV